jgi:hypothetical protein
MVTIAGGILLAVAVVVLFIFLARWLNENFIDDWKRHRDNERYCERHGSKPYDGY